jgi:hypothetical protein
MSSKKLSTLIAVVLTFALLVPFTATAAGILNVNPKISANRGTISQNTVDIIKIKQQAQTLIAKIRSDLAGTKGIESITNSKDYQDIISLLQSLKGTLSKAERNDYVSVLKGAKSKGSADKLTAQDNVIAIQAQKETDLNSAIKSLNDALAKADAIAALKTGSINAWNDYRTKAVQKKQTIDNNHVQIAQSFTDNRNVISNIIATASANKTVLQTKPNEVAAIETKLSTIVQTLKGIYDGSIAALDTKFNADKKNKDYAAALADLDKIISIQQVRITTLTATKSQLQDILNQLNSIISLPATST